MTGKPSVFLLDNFDSFSFNLVEELRSRGSQVHVWRNDLPAEEAYHLAAALPPPAMIVLSPGPSTPKEAGCCMGLVRLALGKIPLFGVCLGHQALVEALGGRVGYAGMVTHGKAASVEHNGKGIFAGVPSPLWAGRYHSLAALELPDELEVTARCGDVVMAVEHRHQAAAGVQFHPESILTTQGGLLMEKVLAWAAERDKRGR